VKNSLDSLSAGRKTELFGWLTEEGRFAPDIGRLLEVLCEKLTALGVISLSTLVSDTAAHDLASVRRTSWKCQTATATLAEPGELPLH